MKEKMSFKKKFLIFSLIWFLIISLILLYARFIGTKGLYVREYKISNKNFVENFYGFKVVHISDIHYGRITKKTELNHLLKKINELKPDLVFFTGDLLDKETNLNNKQVKELTEFLKNINSTNGKYAVSGNHDMHNENLYKKIIKNGGFVNLDNKLARIYNSNYDYILLSGFETELNGNLNFTELDNYFTSLNNNKEQKSIYKIMLVHTPDTTDKLNNYQFDLVLSGHSHNRQVKIPFVSTFFNPVGSKKYYDEYYEINNTQLFISGGIGTSKLNLRLFNHPSFNFYRLTNK